VIAVIAGIGMCGDRSLPHGKLIAFKQPIGFSTDHGDQQAPQTAPLLRGLGWASVGGACPANHRVANIKQAASIEDRCTRDMEVSSLSFFQHHESSLDRRVYIG
jgi:hypothetical protein